MENHKKLYKTTEWQKVRRYVIDRDKGICYFCHKVITSKPTVHHKQELNESNYMNWDIALNPMNLVTCHSDCHNIHHKRFGFKESIVNDDLTIDYTRR